MRVYFLRRTAAALIVAAAAGSMTGCGFLQPRAPQAPVNLTVSPSGSRALTLTWQEGGGDEQGFRIERQEGGSFREIGSVGKNVTRFEVTDLDPKAEYAFRVVAYNKVGPSGPSAEAKGMTLPLTLEEAVAAAKPSVVLVRNKKSSGFLSTEESYSFGTGFVIPGGRVVTNHHVIDGATEVAIRVKETWYQAEVQASDATNDLALLRTDAELPPPLTLGDPEQVREGSALVAIGFPKVSTLASEGFSITSSLAPGTLTAFREREQQSGTSFLGVPLSVTCKLIQMDCPINSGNSGGPVLEVGTGKVVGVSVLELDQAEGIKFAVPVSYVQTLVSNDTWRSITERYGGSSLLGNRPSLFGDRPSLFGNRPSLFGNNPGGGSGGESDYSRVSPIP